jgi:hypothetical protein
MNKLILSVLALVTLAVTSTSCVKKEFDEPPIQTIPTGQLLTIQELRDLYTGSPVYFDADYSVYATVTMDDRSGNIYKNAYIQDGTNALVIRTQFAGGIYEGDSIRLYLKGTTLSMFNGLLQLDSVDVDKNIIKQIKGTPIAPVTVTLSDILNSSDYQAKLIRLENVEFLGEEVGTTYANGTTQTSMNKKLIDCNGNEIIVRTSGYADFADDILPSGSGTIVAILGEFNATKQLYIRKLSEVNLTGERCTELPAHIYLSKNFNDQSLTSGGWSSYVVLSSPNTQLNWTTANQGTNGSYYAVATGYASTNNDTELWLISPAVNLSNATAPGLSFRTAKNFTGNAIQLMISTDYDGVSNPSTQGTWVEYSSFATLSPGSWAWTNSGVIPMTAFLGQSNVRVAYKYTSTTSAAATWQVDDVLINEN